MKRKRYIIPAATRAEIIKNNPALTFKWTISRGRYTYGYNICTLYVDGYKVSSCHGGGYDMAGTCLGEWMKLAFRNYLKRLNPKDFYGLSFYKPGKRYRPLKHWRPGCITRLNGACGFSSMESILQAFGLYLTYPDRKSRDRVYTLRSF